MTISLRRALESPSAVAAAGDVPAAFSPNWINVGHAIDVNVWDVANRAKDRDDERLDAMRVHNGMTLDEFLAKQ